MLAALNQEYFLPKGNINNVKVKKYIYVYLNVRVHVHVCMSVKCLCLEESKELVIENG